MGRNLNLMAACVAGVLLAMATTPSVAAEQFSATEVVQLPDSQTLSAFDISFVDAQSRSLSVSASRVIGSSGISFGTVLIANTDRNVVTQELGLCPPGSPLVPVCEGLQQLTGATTIPQSIFVGDCSTPPARDDISGPNGSLIIQKGANAEVWAGDGPVSNPRCTTLAPTATSGLAKPSTVKVFDVRTGAFKGEVVTGTGLGTETPGIRRADELCYNPVSNVVLIANDDPADNFITFIGEDSLKVIQRISFAGTDPNALNLIANGIEQCAFNPRDGKFYINLPNTTSTPTTLACGTTGAPPCVNGVVLRISGEAPFRVEAIVSDFRTGPLSSSSVDCVGGSGLKIGPDHQIVIACSGANGLVIDDRTGNAVSGGVLTGLGGADEVWYNPGDNDYFFGISTPGDLGVANAGPPPSVDGTFPSASGSHSVAADSRRNQVYVPIRGNLGTTPTSTTTTICSTATDAFGNAGSNNFGCIAIYTAPNNRRAGP
jgi:hypothetical protein